MTRYFFTGWLLLLSITQAGCTTVNEWGNSVLSFPHEPPLALVTRMSDLETHEDRDQVAASVLTEYENNPNDTNMLRLAIVRSFPGHYLHDEKEALVLLESMSDQELSKAEQRISNWLDANLKQRIALQELNSSLREDLQSAQQALEKAREKIEILTRIEQTMGPNSEGKQ